ncbi:LysE family translocator [Reinekea sp.]|jgi:homoserine/homoserine lactone efflux protein|uniref:LysE family translocator n=1 Tax=Reinekea sp. TaxID=1970455 RepID=UPI0039895A3D
MLNWALIVAFVPTFLFVSFTPGMCMTLSMTLGITVGVKRALWMMLGELVGVGIVAICAVVGVAAIMLGAPVIFTAFKWLGGLYLGWLGLQMWRSKGKMAIPSEANVQNNVSPKTLITQGFVTAIANPKGWAFFMVLLPPFIDDSLPLPMQLSVLVFMILTIEFIALLSYAGGGQTLSRLLAKSSNVKLLNRISGTLMIGVAFWLALG